jgi:hypothetical protein
LLASLRLRQGYIIEPMQNTSALKAHFAVATPPHEADGDATLSIVVFRTI